MHKDDTFTTDPGLTFRYTVTRGARLDRRREVVVAVGMRVVVDPLEPSKLKHRGRVGRITKLRLDFIGHPWSAYVTFEDRRAGKGRWGVVATSDLRAATVEDLKVAGLHAAGAD